MLNIRIQKLGSTTVLHCVGGFTFPCADALESLALEEAQRVVLDLADVTAIDAAGLGTLLSLQSWSKTSGRAFKLMNVGPRVQGLLDLTNLRSAFEICSAREMLELLCRALHEAEAELFVPTIQYPLTAGEEIVDFAYAELL